MTAFEFECAYCGWKGTDPTLDAHLNAWCPRCAKPAEFADVLALQKKR